MSAPRDFFKWRTFYGSFSLMIFTKIFRYRFLLECNMKKMWRHLWSSAYLKMRELTITTLPHNQLPFLNIIVPHIFTIHLLFLLQLSISPTFYVLLLCAKGLREAFFCLHFRFELFCARILTNALIKCWWNWSQGFHLRLRIFFVVSRKPLVSTLM
jgi:hypothetical protein